MTAYRDRHLAGSYTLGSVATTTEPEPAPDEDEDNGEDEDTLADLSLNELKARAEALDLPTYGTKADLANRITDASA